MGLGRMTLNEDIGTTSPVEMSDPRFMEMMVINGFSLKLFSRLSLSFNFYVNK